MCNMDKRFLIALACITPPIGICGQICHNNIMHNKREIELLDRLKSQYTKYYNSNQLTVSNFYSNFIKELDNEMQDHVNWRNRNILSKIFISPPTVDVEAIHSKSKV